MDLLVLLKYWEFGGQSGEYAPARSSLAYYFTAVTHRVHLSNIGHHDESAAEADHLAGLCQLHDLAS